MPQAQDLNFVESVYFSVVTITTLGYGDVKPEHWVTQLLTASEAVLGILLIGLFLGAIARDWSDQSLEAEKERARKDYHKNQLSRLRGHYRLMSTTIKNFKIFAAAVTQPMDKRDFKYDENFEFQDMRDLYKSSLRATHTHDKPTIEIFLEYSEELQNNIRDLVKDVDLKEFESVKIEEFCIDFIRASMALDFSNCIVNAKNINSDTTPLIEVVYTIIKDTKGEPDPSQSVHIAPYAALYKQIKYQMEGLHQIEECFYLIEAEQSLYELDKSSST